MRVVLVSYSLLAWVIARWAPRCLICFALVSTRYDIPHVSCCGAGFAPTRIGDLCDLERRRRISNRY